MPVTWPVKLTDTVAQDRTNHPERTNEGVDGKTWETEGRLTIPSPVGRL